jgi:aconitate hydratase
VHASGISVAAVLSGNRNFEGRIHPLVRLNYLASPPLVVAYALAGTLNLDLERAPLGRGAAGQPVFLADLWPREEELDRLQSTILHPALFERSAAQADVLWDAMEAPRGPRFSWEPSGYIGRSPFLRGAAFPRRIADARPLVVLGDNVTTDHISPVGSIAADSPAGALLQDSGIGPADFNTYGARRGNAEVMLCGTFANPRLRNELAGREGGWTRLAPSGEAMTIPAAAAHYRAAGVPTVIVAGAAYGTGSARDWAAKGTRLLGVAAVIAESFERIHRANLALMQVLPIELAPGVRRRDLDIDLHSTISFDLRETLVRQTVVLEVRGSDGALRRFDARLRIDTAREAACFAAGGLLPAIRGSFLARARGAEA